MKKTVNINLANTVFNIDEDAYLLLEKYLYNLKQYFNKQEDSNEIIGDIEYRISELFTERINGGYGVITIDYVETVIARMGKPEEIGGDNNDEKKENKEPQTETPIKKKLYRNIDNKIFGGVLSGLAAYIGMDATALRILFVFLVIFSSIIPVFSFINISWILMYIICWLIIPPAETAAEKLSMYGKKINIDSIGKTVTKGFENAKDDMKDFVTNNKTKNIGDTIINILGVIMKIGLILLFIILSPVIFVLFIAMIVLIGVAISIAFGGGVFLYNAFPYVDFSFLQASPAWSVAFGMGAILVLILPVALLFYSIIRRLFNFSPISSTFKWVLVILWLASFITCSIAISQIDFSYIPTHRLII